MTLPPSIIIVFPVAYEKLSLPKHAATLATSSTQIAWRSVPRECLRDLAGNPIGRWAVRHGNVDQLAAIQSNDDKSIKQVEGKRRDHEQVHRRDLGRMVPEERPPALAGRPAMRCHRMSVSGRMIWRTPIIDGNQRYSWTKTRRSLLVSRALPRHVRPSTISCWRRTAFSASSRAVDLNGETNRAKANHRSPITRSACAIRPPPQWNEVFGTHSSQYGPSGLVSPVT